MKQIKAWYNNFIAYVELNMDASLYLSIARRSIESALDHSLLDLDTLLPNYPELLEPQATFVTLTRNGHLRGCIGSLVAHRRLIDDLISNARAAAFKDPRFPPVKLEELSEIRVEVSLLTPPKLLPYTNEIELKERIRPHIDGIILRLGEKQATFLPQVWDNLNSFDLFFDQLGLKAGIGPNPLIYHPDVFIYQVNKVSEER